MLYRNKLQDCTTFGVISEQTALLYNVRCYIRTSYRTVQRSVLYENKLQDCVTFGVISEKITGLYNFRCNVRTHYRTVKFSVLYLEKIAELYNFRCYIRTNYRSVQRSVLYQKKLHDFPHVLHLGQDERNCQLGGIGRKDEGQLEIGKSKYRGSTELVLQSLESLPLSRTPLKFVVFSIQGFQGF